jgi:hypothetical protein
MIKGIGIFTLGFMIYIANRYMSCSSYAAGYLGVIIQGVGIGMVASEYMLSVGGEL